MHHHPGVACHDGTGLPGLCLSSGPRCYCRCSYAGRLDCCGHPGHGSCQGALSLRQNGVSQASPAARVVVLPALCLR
eukprot:11179241-Lingulodinium_polyedra.AAC.1